MKKFLFVAAGVANVIFAVSVTQPRLVGLGCGQNRLTLVAVEEDEFPAPCYVVDTPRNLCGEGDSAEDCAAYLGDGY